MSYNNNNRNRSVSSTNNNTSSNSGGGGGFGSFLKSFIVNSPSETTNKSLLEGEETPLSKSSPTTTSRSPSIISQPITSKSVGISINDNNNNNGMQLPYLEREIYINELFEQYPETMRSLSENDFLNAPFLRNTKEDEKSKLLLKFQQFKYGNIDKLNEYSKNSNYFIKRLATPFPKIKKITLRWGIYLDYISITYSNNKQRSYGSKEGGTDFAEIILAENEVITKVSGLQREAVIQLQFTTNLNRVYGPYGSNSITTLNGAYPFQSSGFCLKDLIISEGRCGPTIFVKFLVVVSICPDWSGLNNTLQRGLSEVYNQLSILNEKINDLGNKSIDTLQNNNEIIEDLCSSVSTVNSSILVEIYSNEMIEMKKLLCKCLELVQQVHKGAEIMSTTTTVQSSPRSSMDSTSSTNSFHN
ncbi:hypothetical protein ABK040_014188 [Willaertia magna]